MTLAQRGGAGIDEIKALTQHMVPAVIGVYARHGDELKKSQVVAIIEQEVRLILIPASE